MPTSRQRTARWLAGLLLLTSTALAGCLELAIASVAVRMPLSSLDWKRLETEHFEIYSALELLETEDLVVDLERFRRTVEFVWGHSLPDPPRRIRVVAYPSTGNGGRPLRHPDRASSYLIARPEGDLLVLRGGMWSVGFRGAGPRARVELARRMLRDVAPAGAPLWLMEGLAQLAGATELVSDGVDLGVVRASVVEALRSEPWLPVERVMAARDLEAWSQSERERFDRQSWALTHYFWFDGGRSRISASPLRRYLSRVAAGIPQEEAARSALGEKLQERVWSYVNRSEFDSLRLEIEIPRAGSEPEKVEPARIEWLAGEVSLAIGKTDLARRYFRRALTRKPGDAAALAGRALALARLDRDRGEAERSAREARQTAPHDLYVQRTSADALRTLAEATDSRTERDRLAGLARGAYERALAIEDDDPAGWVGLARTQLLTGEVPAALESSARASQQLPGDPVVRRVAAIAALASGDPSRARELALRAHSAARDPSEIGAATALLQRIDDQTALR